MPVDRWMTRVEHDRVYDVVGQASSADLTVIYIDAVAAAFSTVNVFPRMLPLVTARRGVPG